MPVLPEPKGDPGEIELSLARTDGYGAGVHDSAGPCSSLDTGHPGARRPAPTPSGCPPINPPAFTDCANRELSPPLQFAADRLKHPPFHSSAPRPPIGGWGS